MKKLMLIFICFLSLISCADQSSSRTLKDLKQLEDAKIEYITTPVTRGDISSVFQIDKIVASPIINRTYQFDTNVIVEEMHFKSNEMIKAGSLILRLNTDHVDLKIREKNYDVKRAQIKYDEAKALKVSNDSLRIIALDLIMLEAELGRLESEKLRYEIYASEDCLVTSRQLQVGTVVMAKQEVINLVALESFELMSLFDVDLNQYSHIQVGDPIQITYADQMITAYISFITEGKDNYGKLYFKPSQALTIAEGKIFDTAFSGEFEAHIFKDSLLLPSYMIKSNKEKYVEVLIDGKKRIYYLELGISGYDVNNNKVTQILSGLDGNEAIITKTK